MYQATVYYIMLQVTIQYSKPRSYSMTPGRRSLVKALAHNHYYKATRLMLKRPATRSLIIREVGCLLHNEVVLLCSDKVKSVLKSKSPRSLTSFTWSDVLTELKIHAPTLLSLFADLTKTRAKKDASGVICMCASILLKFRNPSMGLIQHMLSVVLYAGRAKKKVLCTIIIHLYNFKL